MAQNMYVALQDDDKILLLDMDENTGALTPKGEVTIAGGPSALALSPNRRNLYVGHRNTNQLSSFSVDPDTGSLTLLGTIPAAGVARLTCPPTGGAGSCFRPTTRGRASASTPSAATDR